LDADTVTALSIASLERPVIVRTVHTLTFWHSGMSVPIVTPVYHYMSVLKVDADSDYLRRVTGKLLRDAITGLETGLTQSELRVQLKYYVKLPDPKTHVNHVIPEVHSLITLSTL